MRLRFWLLAVDVAWHIQHVARRAANASAALYLWTVGRASDATDWGHGAKCGDEPPWETEPGREIDERSGE